MFLSKKILLDISKKTDTGTKISIYIPTHPASTSTTLSEDTIRFKNTLQIIKAHEKYDESELGETIKKLESLLDDINFWKYRTLGLAVFADANGYQTVDLNFEITDMQYVEDTYVTSPLAVMLSIGTGYYVLDINHTKPRLVYFSASAKEEVATESMPGSFEEMVERVEYQKQQQHQSVGGGMFHGHTEADALDEAAMRYHRLIAKCVDKYLVDHDEPLLLTGTQNRIGHMRPLLNYHNVMKEAVEGNNEQLNEQELQNATDKIIENADMAARDEVIEKTKNTPLSSIALGTIEIETAAEAGRVEALFLSAFRRTTDNIRDNYQTSIVLQLPEDVLSIETLARVVLTKGGNIVAVEQGSFENDEPRALCRY
jgi:hypothetical protein